MNVIKLNQQPTLQDALAVLDALRADVVEGKVTGFLVAGVDDQDVTILYVSTTKPISRLRLQGAMSQALHDFQRGVV